MLNMTEMFSLVDGRNVQIIVPADSLTVKLQVDVEVSIRITLALSLGGVAQRLGRQSLAGGLSLIYA